jgi:hypothetical protein
LAYRNSWGPMVRIHLPPGKSLRTIGSWVPTLAIAGGGGRANRSAPSSAATSPAECCRHWGCLSRGGQQSCQGVAADVHMGVLARIWLCGKEPGARCGEVAQRQSRRHPGKSAAIATRALNSALCCFLFTPTSHAPLDRSAFSLSRCPKIRSRRTRPWRR